MQHFPLHFTLENGTKVTVEKTGSNTYDFSLTTLEGNTHHFTHTDDDRTKMEVEASLDFEHLDALRTFWLKTKDMV